MSINQAFSSLKNINSFSKAWNEEIIKSIPSENLLILDVKEEEKWGKLCTFLGTTVPAKSFPKANDSLAFIRQIEETRLRVISKFCKVLLLIMLSFLPLAYLYFQFFHG